MRKLAFALLLALGLAVGTASKTEAAPKKKRPPPDKSPEHIAELIGKLEGEGMPERVRAKGAYDELLRIGRPAVPQLVEATRSEKPYVRVWSAAALASTRDPRAVEPVLRLLEDPFVEVRLIVAWHGAGLHQLDKRIAPAIVRRLGDSNHDVRQWAQRALKERIKFRGAMPELEKMTRGDSAVGRALAFKILMARRGQNPAATIAQALSEEDDWRVRSAAVRCLGEGVMGAHQPLFDLLFRAMDDESEEVKADAVEVMEHVLKETAGRMPNTVRTSITNKLEKKLPPLLDAELPRLRGASLYLLSAGQGRKLFERALKGVDDPAPAMRAYALRALGRCGVKNRQVVDKAISRLDDEDFEVRGLAIAVVRWATGGRFGYKPGDSRETRMEAVKRIKERVEKARDYR